MIELSPNFWHGDFDVVKIVEKNAFELYSETEIVFDINSQWIARDF